MGDARAVVEEWLDAMERRDAERMLGLLADDVKIRVEAMEQPLAGKALLRSSLESFLGACETIRLERETVVASGRNVALLIRARARLRSDVKALGETLPTAGKQLDVLTAVFVSVNEQGKIAAVARVRDTWALMRQLGLSAERMQSLVRKAERELEAARPS